MRIPVRNKGFTLVEMAVVVVILGLMAALILPGIFKTIERNRLERGRAGIEALKNEVIGYLSTFSADANKKLPLDSEIDEFRHYLDPWGRPAAYYYDENLLNDSDPSRQSVCEALSTNLSIQKNSEPQINNIAFILVSSGKNMHQETSYAAGPPQLVTYHDHGQPLGQYEYDDLVAYVSLAELKGKVCTGGGGGGPTTITGFSGFAPAGSDGGEIISERTISIPFVGSWDIGGSGLTYDDDSLRLGVGSTGTSRLFSNGCFWYQEDNQRCAEDGGFYGCTLGDGLRVYFTADFSANGDGFTFSMVSAENNTVDSCGGWAGLTTYGPAVVRPTGELLAYAGPGSSGNGLASPKIGVEFDLYSNTGSGDVCWTGSRNDPGSDHVAFTFWGSDTQTCLLLGNSPTWDDNRHGAQPPPGTSPQNPGPTQDTSNGMVHTALKSQSIHFRYEVHVAQNGDYTLRAWVDNSADPGVDFKNTASDYDHNTNPPTFTMEPTFNAADSTALERIILGFTQATGGAVQDIEISNFELAFR